MARTLYSPRLSDDVVRVLYREGRRRKMPMTQLADELLRQALSSSSTAEPATCTTLHVLEEPDQPDRGAA